MLGLPQKIGEIKKKINQLLIQSVWVINPGRENYSDLEN